MKSTRCLLIAGILAIVLPPLLVRAQDQWDSSDTNGTATARGQITSTKSSQPLEDIRSSLVGIWSVDFPPGHTKVDIPTVVPVIWHINQDGSLSGGLNGDEAELVMDHVRPTQKFHWELLPGPRVLVTLGEKSTIGEKRFISVGNFDVSLREGTMISSDNHGKTKLTHMSPSDITPEFRTKCAHAKEERTIMKNLSKLYLRFEEFCLESSSVISEVRYDQIVGSDNKFRPIGTIDSGGDKIEVVAGEDYTTIHFKAGEAIQVRTADGRVLTYK